MRMLVPVLFLFLSLFSSNVNAIRKFKRSDVGDVGDQMLGEIKAVPYNFVPTGWHACDGALLQVNQYTALFSLLGKTYGGDGVTTFALPDLRGRSIIGVGQGSGLSPINLGGKGGAETVLTPPHIHSVIIPAHTHSFTGTTTITHNHTVAPHSHFFSQASSTVSSAATAPVISVPKSSSGPVYTNTVTGGTDQVTQNVMIQGTTTTGDAINQATSVNSPQSQPVRDPYLALNWIIAIQGIYPTRS